MLNFSFSVISISMNIWRKIIFGLLTLGFVYAGVCGALSLLNREQVLGARAGGEIHSDALPRGFLLGTATAAHQVEGGNTRNDWAAMEHLGHLADLSGRASDEWNRVPQDVALMHDLGANSYRFSIEWSRVEPQQGIWDEAAWAHYVGEIAQLRSASIVPMVTLLHFTLPEWIAERGGVRAAEFPQRVCEIRRRSRATCRSASEIVVHDQRAQYSNGARLSRWTMAAGRTIAAARRRGDGWDAARACGCSR